MYLDFISAHPLHPPCATEESALLHCAADAPAHHSVCFWHVPPALHEDGLSPSDDPAGPCQVR